MTGNETANEITPAQVTQWLQSWAKKGFLAQADKIRKKFMQCSRMDWFRIMIH